jgi:hypothetical protein
VLLLTSSLWAFACGAFPRRLHLDYAARTGIWQIAAPSNGCLNSESDHDFAHEKVRVDDAGVIYPLRSKGCSRQIPIKWRAGLQSCKCVTGSGGRMGGFVNHAIVTCQFPGCCVRSPAEGRRRITEARKIVNTNNGRREHPWRATDRHVPTKARHQTPISLAELALKLGTDKAIAEMLGEPATPGAVRAWRRGKRATPKWVLEALENERRRALDANASLANQLAHALAKKQPAQGGP